jgi:hypothetical protein
VSARSGTCLSVLAAAVACGQDGANPAARSAAAFQNVRRVEIRGHAESAMEPYVSCDGRYLFFNNRNEPGAQTDLYFAERSDDVTFTLRGPLPGANQPPPVLDAVPSMDVRGAFFFISTRSYETTLSTLYEGDFREGRV